MIFALPLYDDYPIRNPPVVLPLLGAWFACVAIVFQGIPLIPWKRLDWTTALLAIWALNAAVNFVTLFACSMLLELLQHQETGRPLRLGRAFRDTVFRNSWILLPLAAVWSLIEIALWTVEILLRRGSDNDSDSAVSTLSEIVQKGLRMGLFLTLPAVAWEELKGFFSNEKQIVLVLSEIEKARRVIGQQSRISSCT